MGLARNVTRKSMATWLVILALGCGSEGFFSPPPCEALYGAPLAVSPDTAFLNIGDTLTMRWSVAFPQCLDAQDTLATYRRWSGQNVGVVAIDLFSGRVVALRPGGTNIVLTTARTSEALGDAALYVLEPPGADSIFTTIHNLLGLSATVVLKGANGMTWQSQAIAAGGWTCWVTPLSDTVRYSAIAGADSFGVAALTNPLLRAEHVFMVTLYGPTPAMLVGPVSPDPAECAPVPAQGYEAPDTFRYQATEPGPVSDTTALYLFQNLGSSGGNGDSAIVTQSTSATTGTATLMIRDSNGMLVYIHDLTADGTFSTGIGYGLNWGIQIVLTDFKGTVIFSVIAH